MIDFLESSGMVEAPPTSPVRDTPVTSPIPMHAPSNIEVRRHEKGIVVETVHVVCLVE